MILASHQPYFFPYLGYFSLISAVDSFVFFDITQFNRKSWMTRNRILKPTLDDCQYIRIGIIRPEFKAMFPDCKINPRLKWETKLIAQLEHYKRIAPYYEEIISFLKQLLMKKEELVVDFNINSTKAIARLLKIDTSFFQFSKMKDSVEKADKGCYWGLNFCRSLGADTYINAPGGEKLYPKHDYKNAGITLGFIQHKLYPYSQSNNMFIQKLSIIDVLMFNGIERTSEMVHDYTIKWVS